MEPFKVPVLPTEQLPVNYQPKQRLRPAPPMWKEKTILRSRTILTIVLTILGFVLGKFFGLSDVDLGQIVDSADGLQAGELLLLAGAVVAGFFRKFARVNLGNPTATG